MDAVASRLPIIRFIPPTFTIPLPSVPDPSVRYRWAGRPSDLIVRAHKITGQE